MFSCLRGVVNAGMPLGNFVNNGTHGTLNAMRTPGRMYLSSRLQISQLTLVFSFALLWIRILKFCVPHRGV